MICREPSCKKEFDPGKSRNKRRYFCSAKCSWRFHHDKFNKEAKAERRRLKAKSSLIPCLGPLCRGEKLFRSKDKKTNRICDECKNSCEFKAQMDGYSINTNRRTSKVK